MLYEEKKERIYADSLNKIIHMVKQREKEILFSFKLAFQHFPSMSLHGDNWYQFDYPKLVSS